MKRKTYLKITPYFCGNKFYYFMSEATITI